MRPHRADRLSRLVFLEMISFIILFHSEPARLIAWCAIGFCGGLYLFFNGFRLLQRRHLVLDTPLSKIRSASMGMVELSGLALGPYTIVAPVTARPCYYFRTVVWEWKRQGRSNQWVKIASECTHVPFFLDDNTGKVLVDPRGAELDLHRDFQQEFCDSFFTTKQEVPPNVRLLLSRHGISTSNKIKVEESCIKPKNALFLLGTLAENPGLEVSPQPICDDEHNTLTSSVGTWFNPVRSLVGETVMSFAGAANELSSLEFSSVSPAENSADHESSPSASMQVIRLSPDSAPTRSADMTQQQKVAAALMRAGIANPAAWAAAGVTPSTASVAATSPVNSATTMKDVFDQRPAVVMMKGKNSPTFLISWRSQREVARSLGWKCALMIWGGPALALLCLYGLLTLTHLI